MPLKTLVPTDPQAAFDVQDSTLSHDLLGRYVANTFQEIDAAQVNGGYPFDAVVIGAGMFGAYCAERLYRHGAKVALRILLIDAGAYLLGTHIQNLPRRLGGKIGGADNLRTSDTGTQNVIWGMPWLSNEGFPGLAYCVGGRSLFWGGWSPRLTTDDLANWPPDIRDYLTRPHGHAAYDLTEREIGVSPSTDYIVKATLYDKLNAAFDAARVDPALKNIITEVNEAPLAVQGSSPQSGVFPFDKFSSAPFVIDAIRDDVGRNTNHGDVSRRIFLLPRTQVLSLGTQAGAVTSIDVVSNGERKTLQVQPSCAVVLANGTIEASRLALNSLGVGSVIDQSGRRRLANLMAHTRSNITVKIKRSALGLAGAPHDLETTAHIVRGKAFGRRFHMQVTAAAIGGPDPEQNMWSMVPDIDLLDDMLANQDSEWITITLRCIGEMENQGSLVADPARSWVDQSFDTDRWGITRAYVNIGPTQTDKNVWSAMDDAAFTLAEKVAKAAANIKYWNGKQWLDARPQAGAPGTNFWNDKLGTTHHEAGPLFMGDPGASVTDTFGKFHGIANTYAVGPAVFPTLGSANPSLTALSLTRRTVDRIVANMNAPIDPAFAAMSLDPKDWTVVRRPANSSASFRHYGEVLESFDGYGLYWYTKQLFGNFILRVEWRVGRRDDNSGVYIRIPRWDVANPLEAADAQGHEIQIDERGYDSTTNTEGHALKRTGAIYDLQAPSSFPSAAIGQWNQYEIEANGPRITVKLNGELVNDYQSNRQAAGHIALQAHHYSSRVQFRGLQIQELP
jgi:choline dehydrogenase-like flavoprotein